jgi:GAF domain-containing protein
MQMEAQTIALIGVWGAVVLLALSVVKAVSREDEALAAEIGRAAGEGAPAPAPDDALTALAAELRWALGAERVTVVLADPYEPAGGRVRACAGAPGLVGRRVRMATTPRTGVVRPAEAAGFGLADADACPAAWTFAHVPLDGDGRLVGAITAASRSRTFTDDDLTVIERVARNRARPFDRRRRRR